MAFPLIVLSAFISFSQSLSAATVSYSGEEIQYTYQAIFRTVTRGDAQKMDQESLALWSHEHAEHLYGLFHSPDYTTQFGLPKVLNEGYVGTQHPVVQNARAFNVKGDPYIWVQYNGAGQALVNRHVLRAWLGNHNEGTVELPLLSDFPSIYTDDKESFRYAKWKNCTDSYYFSAYDFSYFYNPFFCRELGQAPIARNTKFFIRKVNSTSQEAAPVPLAELRGDNGNGRLVTLYFVHGFDETPESSPNGKSTSQITKDAGWSLYKGLEAQLLARNFKKMNSLDELRDFLGEDFSQLSLVREVSLEHHTQRRYFSTYVHRDSTGRVWVVRSGLFPTESLYSYVNFATFWKEAWENGDFIYYGGHSGEGETLSFKNILSDLKGSQIQHLYKNIRLNHQKMQIAFFDACSSYAHYQQMYAHLKPKNLHIITYGLVSMFHLALATEVSMVDLLMKAPVNIRWVTALGKLEQAQLAPQVAFLYDNPSTRSRMYNQYMSRHQYPSYLLNVWLP